MIKVTFVEPAGPSKLLLGFSDGSRGVVDLASHLDGPIFEALRSPTFFAQAKMEEGTVVWPNGADYAPEFLHALANGFPPPATGEDAKAIEREVSLREIRRSVGLRQEDVAAALKVSQSELSQFEGRDDRLVSTLKRYAVALGGRLEVAIVIDVTRHPVGGM
jgi:DNA-binding XRE family transcriptional regulator